MPYTEYTVEVYNENGKWVEQVDVFPTFDEASQYIDDYPMDIMIEASVYDEGSYYSIWFIDYNEKGEEVASGPVY